MGGLVVKNRLVLFGEQLGLPWVDIIGFDQFKQPFPVGSHSHDMFELSYIDSGQINWQLSNGEVIKTRGHEVSLIQPSTIHSGEFDVASPASLFWMCFDVGDKNLRKSMLLSSEQADKMQQCLENFGNASARVSENVAAKIREIYATVTKDVYIHELDFSLALLHCHLNALLITIVEEITNQTEQDARLSSHSEQARCYIEANLHREIDLSMIANHVGISMSRLIEVFRCDVGTTPIDYLQRSRCRKGKEMLAMSKQSVTDITFNVGFGSTQYFATCFKKYYGQTPSEYRRKHAYTVSH